MDSDQRSLGQRTPESDRPGGAQLMNSFGVKSRQGLGLENRWRSRSRRLDPKRRRSIGFALRFVGHPIRAIRAHARLAAGTVNIFGSYTVMHPHNVMVGENLSVNHHVFIVGRSRIVIGKMSFCLLDVCCWMGRWLAQARVGHIILTAKSRLGMKSGSALERSYLPESRSVMAR